MMGKGGVDLSICAQLRELMGNHPYDPQGWSSEVPEPYRLADAVKELYPKLSDDELRRMLLHTFIEGDFMEVRDVLSRGGTSADKLVGAVARDIIRAYAAANEELSAEDQRRHQLYKDRRWSKREHLTQ